MMGAALVLLLLLVAGVAPPPTTVMIATARGEMVLPVRRDAADQPVVFAAPVVLALGGSVKLSGAWAEVVISGQPLRLLVGAPLYVRNNRVHPMAGRISVINDTLFVPLQFLSQELPRLFAERLTWDGAHARLVETGWKPPPGLDERGDIPLTVVSPTPRHANARRLPNGLREGHMIVVDPGHGGEDAGNPGLFFPNGLKEKHVTLQVGMLLRRELEREGIKVRMTRTTDVLPRLLGRAPQCTGDCDIFVSLHVDALDPRRSPNYRTVDGFHTIIVGKENTEDAARIARMENEALRYEAAEDRQAADDLAFLLNDLRMNEFLRESARAGALIQEKLSIVHTGRNLGVKQRNDLAVLNTARRPAVLVEMGFASNPSDARLMADPAAQQRIARAIAQALVSYLLEYERRVGDTPGVGP